MLSVRKIQRIEKNVCNYIFTEVTTGKELLFWELQQYKDNIISSEG